MRKWASLLLWCLGLPKGAWASSGMVLANGVRVWAEEDPEAGPLLGIWVDSAVGAGAETTGWAGAAHLIEHLRARDLGGPPARRTAWTTTEQTHFETIGLLTEAEGLIQTEVRRQQPWQIRFSAEDLSAALAAERAVMRLETLAREPARREEAALRQRLFPVALGADPLGPDGRPEQDIAGFTPEVLGRWEAGQRGKLPGGGLVVYLRAAVPEAQLLAWGAAFGQIQTESIPDRQDATRGGGGVTESQTTPAGSPTGRPLPTGQIGPKGGSMEWEGPGPKGCTAAFAIPGEGHPDLGLLRALALAWSEPGRRVWTDVGAQVGVFFVRWDRPCPRGSRALPPAQAPTARQLSAWEQRRTPADFAWRGRAASACRPRFLAGGEGAGSGISPGEPLVIVFDEPGLSCASAATEALRQGASASPAALRAVAERWLAPHLGQWGWR